MADQISRVGPEIFLAMSKFIVLFYIGAGILFILATILIWIKSGKANPIKVLGTLLEPMIIAFATRNSMSALPSAINTLDKGLGFDSTSVGLTLPLGMTIGRFGNIFYFGLASFFVTQIYGINLGIGQYALILLGVVFAGTATAGASGIVTLSLISIVLNPLGLPVEAILVILMAIDPIIDPGRTFLIVHCNIMSSALMAPKRRSESTTIRVLVPKTDRRPFVFSDSAGEVQGLEIDLIREVANRLGMQVEVLRVDNPLKEQGNAHILADRYVHENIEVPNGLVPSVPYSTAQSAGKKVGLCFLLAEDFNQAAAFNEILRGLKDEQFVNRRIGALA
jgi:hypothetical protein